MLAAIFTHPGAGLFARSCVGIKEPQPDMLIILIQSFPDAHIRMIDGHLSAIECNEAQAEQSAGDKEHAFAQFLKLQIRFEFSGIQIIARLAHPLSIVAVVPRSDPDAIVIRKLLHVGHFLMHA